MPEAEGYKIKVIVADDHTILADGIENMLNKKGAFEVVAKATNGEEVIKLLKMHRIDVVIMDINMPVMDGLEATRVVKEHFPEVKVLIMSMHDKEGYIQNALEAGADGYILKNTSQDEMERALIRISEGGNYFSQDVSTKMAMKMVKKTEEEKIIKLSRVEKQVLSLLSEGKTSDEISVTLGTSSHTIRSYRRNLMVKFNAKNVTQLIAMAIKKGYIS
ncbi:MAG: response regulator transcription factor [Cyclobacteriaceae bacterium]|nr:response regulator transcription factor [Cyclobacteriaceae bacterium]